MTDQIFNNLMMLAQHVCDSAGIAEVSGTELADHISDLEEYLENIRRVRDMTFASDDVR